MVNYTSSWGYISQASLTQLNVLAFLLYLLVSAILHLYLRHTSFFLKDGGKAGEGLRGQKERKTGTERKIREPS